MHIDQVTNPVNKRHYTKKDNVPGTSKIVVGRQCKVCKKQSTSQWRRGPDGSTSLCNACGLRYQWILKREKKIVPKMPKTINIHSLLNSENDTKARNPPVVVKPLEFYRPDCPLPLSYEVRLNTYC